MAELFGAAQHQFGKKASDGLKTFEVVFIAVAQREQNMRFLATGLLRQERNPYAFWQLLALHADFNIFRRGFEDFSFGNGRAALIIGHQAWHVGRCGNRHAVGFLGRNKQADRAIVPLEVASGNGFNGLGRDFFDLIAVQEIKAPISLCGPFAERNGNLAGVGGRQLAGLEDLLLCAADFLGGNSGGADLLDGRDDQVARFLQRTIAWNFGLNAHQARIMLGSGKGGSAGRFFGFDQGFIQSSRWLCPQYPGEDL